jgi:DhnA family fructose-bisphosphate aldolase class Ia
VDGKLCRLREFLRAEGGRGLIVDASAGLSLGALRGLEDFEGSVRPILALVDGVVCSPGQLRRLTNGTRGEAGLLVRMDWNNTLRGSDFVLPPATPHRVPILTPQDALDLGAVAMVGTFLLGYEEEIEAASLRNTVQWALEGNALGLPLVMEVQANGPRVSLPDKAVELGASYALEGGADVVVIPHPGHKSLETIATFVSVQWLVKPSSLENASAELDEALSLGGAGLWLDHRVFTLPDPIGTLTQLSGRMRKPLAA